MQHVYVFTCNSNSNSFGFTLLNTGANLPLTNCTGWTLFKEIDISRESPVLIGASAIDILNGIEQNGYYITGAGVSIQEQ